MTGNEEVPGNEEVLEGFEIISNETDTLKFLNDNGKNESIRLKTSDPGYENWKQGEDFKVNYTKWLNEDKDRIEYIYTHCQWQCIRRYSTKEH